MGGGRGGISSTGTGGRRYILSCDRNLISLRKWIYFCSKLTIKQPGFHCFATNFSISGASLKNQAHSEIPPPPWLGAILKYFASATTHQQRYAVLTLNFTHVDKSWSFPSSLFGFKFVLGLELGEKNALERKLWMKQNYQLWWSVLRRISFEQRITLFR